MAGPKRIRKSSRGSEEWAWSGRGHRFEHWYVNNQVYFITARCRGQFPALASECAKEIFWDRFTRYAGEFGYEPFVTSVLDNHYHTLGYLRIGENLKLFMQRLHGSVAKLVNDELVAQGTDRRERFWRDQRGHEYFDGCIRDAMQYRKAYRYTLMQSVRAGICADWRMYPHTRVGVELEEGLERAKRINALLEDVPYKRYEG